MDKRREKYADRRGSKRFSATHRVEYEVDGRRNISFLANMSMGGMFLRSAGSLSKGDELDFRVMLDDGKEPLDVRGMVLEDQEGTGGAGARIRFPEGQEAAFVRMREYTEGHVGGGRSGPACAGC